MNWENKIDPILKPACCFEHKSTPGVESLVASLDQQKARLFCLSGRYAKSLKVHPEREKLSRRSIPEQIGNSAVEELTTRW